jgi:hypothetical protein
MATKVKVLKLIWSLELQRECQPEEEITLQSEIPQQLFDDGVLELIGKEDDYGSVNKRNKLREHASGTVD